MKILDKYVVSEIIFPLISGILAFSFILSGSTILPKLVSDAIKYNIPVQDILLLISLKMPYVFSLAIPMATLFATITVFGRLGNDLEIIALWANGISIVRLLIPTIVMGCIISLLAFACTEYIVPRAASTAEVMYQSYKHQQKPIITKNINITEYDKKNNPKRILHIGQMDKGMLENITISEFDDGHLARLIRAKSGQWLNLGAWEFYNGVMHSFLVDDPGKITILEFEKEFINLNMTPQNFENREKDIDQMNRKELLEKIEFKKRTGEDPIKYIMDYHLKLSVAFSCLIYSILGATMGLRPHRSSSALGLGLSIIVILIYIVLISICMGLGLSKMIPPVLAAWLPNIIVGIFSLFLLQKRAAQ